MTISYQLMEFRINILNIKFSDFDLRIPILEEYKEILFDHQAKEMSVGGKKLFPYRQICKWKDDTEIHYGDERVTVYPRFIIGELGRDNVLLVGKRILSWLDPSSDDKDWDKFQENKKMLKNVCLEQGWKFM